MVKAAPPRRRRGGRGGCRPVQVGEAVAGREVVQHGGVVADQQEGRLVLEADLADQRQGGQGEVGIEAAGGFVGQDQERPVGQGARHGDPLLLAGRELRRPVIAPVGQADPLEQVLGEGAVVAAGEAHGDQHVLQRGESLQQVAALEDVADRLGAQTVPARLAPSGHRAVADQDLPLVGGQDAGDQVQERGLAGAAGALQGDLVARGEPEVGDVDDRDPGPVRRDEAVHEVVDR
jgi:hypothetical protein